MTDNLAPVEIDRALNDCETVQATGLADYVEDYFKMSEKELACMPGAPSQVMAAQFVLHARLAVDLTEVHTTNTELFDKVVDLILRSPSARSRRRR